MRDGFVQCAKQAIIFAKSDEINAFTILQTVADHDHNELPGLKKGKFSDDVVRYIVERKRDGYMPKKIVRDMHELKEKNERFVNDEIPSRSQLAHIITRESKANDERFISLGDLLKWVKSKDTFPVDIDECFVVNYAHGRKPKGELWFHFAVSTPRLLRYCIGLEKLCIDATYKLNWNGYPLIIMGTTDMQKRFHPLFFVCTSHEETKDYEFAFKSLKNVVENELNTPFNPKYIIADAAPAIKKAFFKVFRRSAKMHIMCFAHVIRNVRKYKFANSKANMNQILDDIRKLQLSHSKKVSKFVYKKI